MRTLFIILAGVILLAIVAIAARQLGGGGEAGAKTMGVACLVFIPLWLAAALVNMYIGVSRAGYSVTEELPIMLLIFAVPGLLAGLAWWKFS